MKCIVMHTESSKERTVEDIMKEVEDLKQNKTENSVRFDDRVQTQDIVDYGLYTWLSFHWFFSLVMPMWMCLDLYVSFVAGPERHGFDLSPVHTGEMDETDSHGYDLSPLDKVECLIYTCTAPSIIELI